MTKKDKKEFKKDCLALYRNISPHLYMRWSKKYTSLELRMEFAKILMNHAIDRYRESIDKRLRTKHNKKAIRESKKVNIWLADNSSNVEDVVLSEEV